MRHVELLRELRFKAGMPTLRQIGERSDISHTAIASILRGDTFTSMARVEAIARALTPSEARVKAVVNAWQEDHESRRQSRSVATGDRMGKAENSEVQWVLIPADAFEWVEHVLNGLGHRLVLVKGQTWAAVPKDD